jgi:sugar lactone lactonase YvrE
VKGSIRARLQGHTGHICALAYSPDGRTLASGDSAGTIKLWDTRTDRERATIKGHRGNVLCLAFSPDGTTLASGSLDQTVRLWNLANGQEQASLKGPRFAISAVAFSPDGKSVAAGGKSGYSGAVAPAYAVIIWDAAKREERATIEGHAGGVRGLAFTPDSRTLAVSSGDGTLKLWAGATGKVIAAITGAGGGPLAVTPDGKTVVSAAGDRVVLTDVATYQLRAGLKVPWTETHCLALSADGKWLAVGGYSVQEGQRSAEHPILLWDLSTAKELERLQWEGRTLDCLAFSPDGKTLASGGINGVISLWKLEGQPPNE